MCLLKLDMVLLPSDETMEYNSIPPESVHQVLLSLSYIKARSFGGFYRFGIGF